MTLWDTQKKKEVKSCLSTRLHKLDLERLAPAPVSFSLRSVVFGWHVRLPECSFGLNWGWEDGVGVLCSGCIVSVKVYIAWCLWAG